MGDSFAGDKSEFSIVTRAFDSAERAADDLADYFTSSAIREFRQHLRSQLVGKQSRRYDISE